jgi:hypothetical protein
MWGERRRLPVKRALPLWLLILMLTMTPVVASADDGSGMRTPPTGDVSTLAR